MCHVIITCVTQELAGRASMEKDTQVELAALTGSVNGDLVLTAAQLRQALQGALDGAQVCVSVGLFCCALGLIY